MERIGAKIARPLVLGVVVLSVLVAPIGIAGAAGDKPAPTSAKVAKQVKKLKRQVSLLQRRLDEVSRNPGAQGPVGPSGADGPQGAPGPAGPATGPAGGDLTGTYPNPLIGPNAVGSTEIADNSVSSDDIQDFDITGSDIDRSTVVDRHLDSDSVGSSELKGVTPIVGPGVTVNGGEARSAQVDCPQGQMVISGGFAWRDEESNTMYTSAPNERNPNTSWIVSGYAHAGSNVLYAWANCLAL